MEMNFLALIGAALIPLVVGAVWYSPKAFGTSWLNAIGKTEEDLAGANMPLIFGLTFVFSILLALGLSGVTIHQNGILQLFATDPTFTVEGSEINVMYNDLMNTYADRHRTFGHGAVHGAIATIILALPFIGINALFERRGAKYIFIHLGYWLITLILMSGIICQWL